MIIPNMLIIDKNRYEMLQTAITHLMDYVIVDEGMVGRSGGLLCHLYTIMKDRSGRAKTGERMVESDLKEWIKQIRIDLLQTPQI